ncbi:MAG: hypothetical protein H0W88_11600 [Parachlamydiaceae bacterium]|nr:hypothetical protein [Parachlamydiaceae bacterium]
MNSPNKEIFTIAIFGEAEKGDYQAAYYCQNLVQLDEYFGNPPQTSRGLYYAVQALLFKRNIIFFRVREEGYSPQDYFQGLILLKQQLLIPQVNAICTPGVGNKEIIDAVLPICSHYHSIMITNESDFYDYLTDTQ